MSSKNSGTFVDSTVATVEIQTPAIPGLGSNFNQTKREESFSLNGNECKNNQSQKKELDRYSDEDLVFFENNLLSLLKDKEFIHNSNEERIGELGRVENKDENIMLINALAKTQEPLSRYIQKIKYALNRIKNKNYGQKPGGGLFTKEELLENPLRIK